MYPYFGPVESYAVFYIASLVIHGVLAFVFARRVGVGRWMALVAGLSFAVSMGVGARILYDVTRHHTFPGWELFSIAWYERGGLWGGPLVHLGLMGVIILAFARRRGPAFDMIALSLPIPMLIAKVACLLNGCCHGAPTSLPIALRFGPNPGGAPENIPLHPTQVYDLLVLAIIFAVLLALSGERGRGRLMLWFLMLYGIGRGLVEFLRGDGAHRFAIGPLSASQLLCLAAALASGACLLWLRRRARRAADADRVAETFADASGGDAR